MPKKTATAKPKATETATATVEPGEAGEGLGSSLPPATSGTSGTFRRWVMTIFDEDGSRRDNLETLPDFVLYLAYGDEVTKEGKKHYQCFVYTEKVRFSKFEGWIGKSFREPMKGTFKENQAYCSKQGVLKEFGERPEQGARKDLLTLKRKIEEKSGVDVLELAEDEELFGTVAKHHKFMGAYNNHFHGRRAPNNEEVHVTYICGPPGCGKTRFVREFEPDVYDCPPDDNFKWKDGYQLHEAVLYDNIDYDSFSPGRILKELDRYKIQVPVKGGFVWWKPKRVYITSVLTPDLISEKFANKREFTRRITVYKLMQ